MRSSENFQQFKDRLGVGPASSSQLYVSRIEDHKATGESRYQRRDFYKIMLFETAAGQLDYAGESIPVADQSLVFTNPMIPYAWVGDRIHVKGFICAFTEPPLIQPQTPVFQLDRKTYSRIKELFIQIEEYYQSDYHQKFEGIRSYIQIITHTILKSTPPKPANQTGASARITYRFLDLLQRQFPLLSPREELKLKNAGEFAAQLSIHTNHLNKALRQFTGLTTSQHISAQIAREARALLLHSDWTVTEIASALGFNHSANFDIFFKKHTGQSPIQFKKHPH